MTTTTTKTAEIPAYSYIRFSSKPQEKGDSIRRQTAGAEAYATAKGLTLDRTLKISDFGKSAYKGDNLKAGLGVFLEAVESGRVKRGSFLLVESVDRISRQGALRALPIITALTDAGIKVVTLSDGQVYDETLVSNVGQQVAFVCSAARAWEESETKSKRVKAAISNRIKNAYEGKICSWAAPSWVKIKDDKFHLVQPLAATVTRMFKMFSSGMGCDLIARTLNREGIQTVKNDSGWGKATVKQILRNRKALGEYSPMIDGKPAGATIPNYYPSVIDAGTFAICQQRLTRKTKTGRGSSEAVNLFCGLVKTEDGTPYVLKSRTQGKSLVSKKAIMGMEAGIGFDYARFEMFMLIFLQEINLQGVLAVNDNGQRQQLKADAAETQNKIDAMTKAMAAADANDIGELVQVVKMMKAKRDNLNQQIETLTVSDLSGDSLSDLLANMTTADTASRHKVRTAIADLVDSITVSKARKTTNETYGRFTVNFRNGKSRWVELTFQGRRVKGDAGIRWTNVDIHAPMNTYDHARAFMTLHKPSNAKRSDGIAPYFGIPYIAKAV